MNLVELMIIAIGVSMDAFAVSICKGLSTRKIRPANAATAGLWFGGFQALMPVIGYYLGVSFADFVSGVDHWIAFVLLAIIGGKMVKESFENESCEISADFSFKSMFPLAIATSIDAMAVGVTMAMTRTDLLEPWYGFLLCSAVIGIITFACCSLGVQLGCKTGSCWGKRAEIGGGIVLIVIGVKILLEHLLG